MKHLSKVLWSEGMYLGPQHFQAQNRYFEDSLHFATSNLWFAAYGLLGAEVNEDELRNGTLALVNARGIFPDGLAFHMPESDALPAARNIADSLSPLRDNITAYLGIPVFKPGAMNCATANGHAVTTRYIAEARVIHDENSGRDEKTAQFGRKNIQLLLDGEVSDDFTALPIARIRRGEAGRLVLDPRFVPPCLQITASPHLMLMLRRLIEILEEKNRTMAGSDAAGIEAFSLSDVARFWLLHAVNSNLVRLRHLYYSKRSHPEELYTALASLAGALCTFKLNSSPLNLPLYDHDHLDDCFDQLDRHVRSHLDVIIPTNSVTIPLNPVSDSFYLGTVTDTRCLSSADWILAVHCPPGRADIIEKTPQLVKVCSNEFIAKLVQRALPGLPLVHLPVPPPAVKYSLEKQYFSIGRGGPCWDHIVKTQLVGVYAPEEIPQTGLEVIAVLPA
jgi:type VI secretion system protein ImpJ